MRDTRFAAITMSFRLNLAPSTHDFGKCNGLGLGGRSSISFFRDGICNGFFLRTKTSDICNALEEKEGRLFVESV